MAKNLDLIRTLIDFNIISKSTGVKIMDDETSDWSNILSPEFYENIMKENPISVIQHNVFQEEGITTETSYKCDVCKKTPCKHFIMEDGMPKLTKEAELINKLAGVNR